jgi:Uma2 family endonuclease
MDVDSFIAWAMEQPEGTRYELDAGRIIAMSPERLGHARMKGRIFMCLVSGIAAKGLPCEAVPDGVGVRVDDGTLYEPDALVRCGGDLPGDTRTISDPIIIVEVLSPSTRGVDNGAKLAEYFRLPTLAHYLIVHPETARVIHHRRDEMGDIHTRIRVPGEPLLLDPPGIVLEGYAPAGAFTG